jgi:GNAT superfamily N-acetyltransferase
MREELRKTIYRPMTRGDIDLAIAGFRSQNWDKPREVLESYYAEQEQGARKVVIAEIDGEIAGYVTLLPHARGGVFKERETPEICDFVVFEKFQRQGVGTELMNRIEAEAVKLSNTVCLGVGLHSGYGAAQRLYIKRGYIPDGSGVWYGHSPARQYGTVENSDDLVLYMSKTLTTEQGAFWTAIDTLISKSQIVIDRPKGTRHPRFDFTYPLDYGYLKDTSAMDGGGIDVWRGSFLESICDAVACTVDLLKRDSEIKLLIGCNAEEKAVIMRFHNNSEYMKGVMIRRDALSNA